MFIVKISHTFKYITIDRGNTNNLSFTWMGFGTLKSTQFSESNKVFISFNVYQTVSDIFLAQEGFYALSYIDDHMFLKANLIV